MKVYLDVPSPLHAGALRDDNGLIVGYWYTYKKDLQEETEICALGKYLYPELTHYAEMTFLEQRRGDEVVGRAMYDLGGMLLHDERSGTRLLISDSVLSEQRQLNTANTLKGINLKDHGFTQEDLLNVDIPGVWQDANGQPISEKQAASTAGAKFVAAKITKGSNVSRAWEGAPVYDEKGVMTSRATPNVLRHQPSSSQEFRDDIEHIMDILYFLARQLHRRLSGDAVASGEARVQAQEDFQLSLEPTKRQYEAAVQWLLTTLLRLSALLSGRRDMFDGLRIVCNARNAAVQPSPERLRVFNEMRKDDQVDTETHLELTGVTNDVDATVARMRSEGILESGAAERADILMQLADKGRITPEELRAELIDLGILPDTFKAKAPGQIEPPTTEPETEPQTAPQEVAQP